MKSLLRPPVKLDVRDLRPKDDPMPLRVRGGTLEDFIRACGGNAHDAHDSLPDVPICQRCSPVRGAPYPLAVAACRLCRKPICESCYDDLTGWCVGCALPTTRPAPFFSL